MPEYASQVNKKLLTVIVALMISGATFAQVQVVDAASADGNQSAAQNSQNSTANSATGSSNNNDIVVTLYNMLEALQQEVQMLRGMVEEQGYQIRRMESEQRDRYLDVDNRLSALNQRISQGGALPMAVCLVICPQLAQILAIILCPDQPPISRRIVNRSLMVPVRIKQPARALYQYRVEIRAQHWPSIRLGHKRLRKKNSTRRPVICYSTMPIMRVQSLYSSK